MLKLDELALQPASPELVVSEANDTHGLDLLGLRAPAESVANRLINGVTTVTPTTPEGKTGPADSASFQHGRGASVQIFPGDLGNDLGGIDALKRVLVHAAAFNLRL